MYLRIGGVLLGIALYMPLASAQIPPPQLIDTDPYRDFKRQQLVGSYPVVAPETQDQFGNPEEPATRPYRWVWHGVKALVFHPLDALKDGYLQAPPTGVAYAGVGLRRGTVEFVESVARGSIFASVPPSDAYKDTQRVNAVIEDDPFLENSSDLLFTWYAFPLAKHAQHYPYVSDSEYADMESDARRTREARREAERAQRDPEETRVERAQRKYLGDRMPTRDERDAERGNLLRLGR